MLSLILIAIGSFFAVAAKNVFTRGLAVFGVVLGVVGWFVFIENDGASSSNEAQDGLTTDSVTWRYENLNKENGLVSMVKYSDGRVRCILMKTPTVFDLKRSWWGYSVLLCDTLQGKPVFKEVEITKTCYDTLVIGQRLDYFDFQGKLNKEQKELDDKFDWALSAVGILFFVFSVFTLTYLLFKVMNGRLF